jgi:hypothetical protein
MLTGRVGSKVNLFVRKLSGDLRPTCIELEYARIVGTPAVIAHGGAVTAAVASPVRPSDSGGPKAEMKLSEMRLLQSQVLGQLGVRKSVGYTGAQDFLKRRHGLGRCDVLRCTQ